MADGTRGFQRLLITKEALVEPQGEEIAAIFEADGVPITRHACDEELEAHPQAESPGTLQVRTAPFCGWITSADHGLLASRGGEFYLHPVIGCQLGCSYCYLLARPHGRRPLRYHVGLSSLFDALDRNRGSAPHPAPLLYSTGELGDSLADADLFPVAALLADHFASRTDARLELRTKSDKVSQLLQVAHGGRTTVAFSIAPQGHIDRYEPGTASLDERLDAAARCQAFGYPVALKVEPLLLSPAWQDAYDHCVKNVASRLDIAALEHVSVGCLRWSEELGSVGSFRRRYAWSMSNASRIEYKPGRRNETLPFDERLAAYVFMRRLLQQHGLKAPIWWSLEEPTLLEALKASE